MGMTFADKTGIGSCGHAYETTLQSDETYPKIERYDVTCYGVDHNWPTGHRL